MTDQDLVSGAGLELVPAGGPVREPAMKVGGQPVWLAEPQWPLSETTGEPLQFLGQFPLDGGRLAYLFMGDGEDVLTGAPEGGENAVLIQPDGRIPEFVSVRAQAEGPTACRTDHVPRPTDRDTWVFLGGPGVEPNWIREERYPAEGWELVVQLSSSLGEWLLDSDLEDEEEDEDEFVPCYCAWDRSGWGVAWVFLSPDGKEGRFAWDCV